MSKASKLSLANAHVNAHAATFKKQRDASAQQEKDLESTKNQEAAAAENLKRWQDAIKKVHEEWGVSNGKLDTKNIHAPTFAGMAEAAVQSAGKAYDNYKSAHQELTHLLKQLSFAINADVNELTQKPIPGLGGTSAGGLALYAALGAVAAPAALAGGALAATAAIPAAPFALFAYLARGTDKSYWQFNEDQFDGMTIENDGPKFGPTGFPDRSELDKSAQEAAKALFNAYPGDKNPLNFRTEDFKKFCRNMGVKFTTAPLLEVEPERVPASPAPGSS